MDRKEKIFFWIAGLALLGLFIYSISSILLPFIVAIIMAYFLDPAADRLEKLGCSRTFATTIITVSFFIAAAIIIALLAPVFYDQFLTFLHTVPTYIDYINNNIIPVFSTFLQKIDQTALEKAKESVSGVSGYAIKFLGTLMGNIWNSGLAVINLLSLIFVSPIVTFYMLRDWDKIIAALNKLLPPKYAGTIRSQAKEIDHTLSGFIRGQTYVCLILGAFYAVALSIAGLQFSVFIGLASGLLLFIPYVGALFGFVVGMIVAFFQFGDIANLGVVAGIFLVGQIAESMFITPNLVGNKVGLHPVWIIFALLAGGAMFGFLGVLLAIPGAAVIGVLLRFFCKEYVKKISVSSNP